MNKVKRGLGLLVVAFAAWLAAMVLMQAGPTGGLAGVVLLLAGLVAGLTFIGCLVAGLGLLAWGLLRD